MSKECEIVQDLLFSYADGVLHQESRKLVERHLIECEECRKQLEEIQTEGDKERKKIQKEINYLKEVNRKAKIKVIKILCIMLLMIGIISAIIFYGNRFSIIHNMAKIYENNQSANSYYIVHAWKEQDNNTAVLKEWYKDGKGKEKYEIQKGTEVETIYEKYIDYETKKQISVYKNSKTYNENNIQELTPRKVGMYPSDILGSADSWQEQLKATFFSKMRTENDARKKWYVFYNNSEEIWMDAETLLYDRKVSKNYTYDTIDSSIILGTYERTHYMRVYIANVEDEEVELPDLTEYEKLST